MTPRRTRRNARTNWRGRDTSSGSGRCRPNLASGVRLGLWRAQDAAEMQAIMESLPLHVWMTVETTPLTQHPNDPAIAEN